MTHAPESNPAFPRHVGDEGGNPTIDQAADHGVHEVVAEPQHREPATSANARIKRTRVSGTWIAVVVALLVLIFLLVFILQNLDPATVHFLGFSGSLPLAVAMLFATIAGGLLVALVGAARIFQLRKETRKARKAAVR